VIYGPDLAAFHHLHAADLAREAAEALLIALAAGPPGGGLVADVGCGSGVLAASLTAHGYDVLAVDPSPAMLELTARTAPAARRLRATASDLVAPGSPLPDGLAGIACVGEVLAHDRDLDLDEALQRFGDALRPGGVLLLDLPGPGRHGGPRAAWAHDADDALVVVDARERRRRLTRAITTFTAAGAGLWRRSDEVHDLRLHDPADVRAALARAGFVAIRQLDRYGTAGPAFGPGWAAFLAERPV
jgi:SAM-dependent methyltransferase